MKDLGYLDETSYLETNHHSWAHKIPAAMVPCCNSMSDLHIQQTCVHSRMHANMCLDTKKFRRIHFSNSRWDVYYTSGDTWSSMLMYTLRVRGKAFWSFSGVIKDPIHLWCKSRVALRRVSSVFCGFPSRFLFFFRLWDLAKTSKNVFEASSEEEPEIVKTNEDSGTEEDTVLFFFFPCLVTGGCMWMSSEYRYICCLSLCVL